MRHLIAPLRGLVLDYLTFSDVLSATTIDRTGRESLEYIRKVFHVKDHVLSSGLMMDKLTLCEGLLIDSKDGLVWERVGWALRSMRHLRDVFVRFYDRPRDETSWRRSCATLALSPELGRLRMLRTTLGDPNLTACVEFKSLLLRLSPDCALATAIDCEPCFPVGFISELLRPGANPNARIPDICRSFEYERVHGIHPLTLACSPNRLEVMQLLLDNGATPPDCECSGTTDTFYEAVDVRSLDVLRLLYDAGHKSTRTTRHGENLLHMFGFDFHRIDAATTISMVELICERQPELLTQYDKLGHTPLMLLNHQFVRDLFRKDDIGCAIKSPAVRASLFKSLSKCMVDSEAKLRLRASE